MDFIQFSGFNKGNQIAKNYGDIHFHAPVRPETPPTPLSTVPFRRDPDFVECENLLDQLRVKGFIQGNRIALVGLGGVGKTQIAVEYCHRVRDSHPETWVLWIHASNEARFEQSCWAIANRFKIPGRLDPTANIYALLHQWLNNPTTGNWVIILDNLDNGEFLHATSEQRDTGRDDGIGTRGRSIWSYIGESSVGVIVATSRSRQVAVGIAGDDDIISVEPMDKAHAISLFAKKVGGQCDQADRAAMIDLTSLLDFMPLAIVQAASFIRRRMPRESVVQYLERFRKSDHEKLHLLGSNGEELRYRRDRAAKNSILITWQISFEDIKERRPTAADLLSLMSFFERQDIPDVLLRQDQPTESTISSLPRNDVIDSIDESVMPDDMSGLDEADCFEDDVLMLRDYSLVSISSNSANFAMHRLVQLATQDWLKAHNQLENWKERFIRKLYHAFPEGRFENWKECQMLFAHVQNAVAQQPCSEISLEKWAALLHEAASFAWVRGNFIDSKMMAQNAAKARQKLFGAESLGAIASFNILGLAYHSQGQWKNAEELQLKVMKSYGQALGPNDPNTLTSIANLALTYYSQGQFEQAEELQTQVMNSYKQALGSNHPKTLTSIANLASTYHSQGRWQKAEELGSWLLETRREVLGPEHSDTLTSIANLALTYHSQGRWKEAEELETWVMETRKQVLGPDHSDTLTSIANLAMTYQKQGKWNKAEELGTLAVNTRKQVLGPEHPHTLISMSNLASIFWNQGRWKETQELEIQVMEISQQILGPEHPDTLRSIGNLAMTYYSQECWKEAEKLQVQLLKTSKQVFGLEHPNTLTTIGNLASTFWNQGQWKEAERLQIQAIEISKQLLGPEHSQTLLSLANLAMTYSKQKQWEEAKDIDMRVMEARKQTLGLNHPDTLTSMNNLAFTLKALGQDEAALQIMVECATIRDQQLGSHHPHTLSSISALNKWRGTSETTSSNPSDAENGTQQEQNIQGTSTQASSSSTGRGLHFKRAVLASIFSRNR